MGTKRQLEWVSSKIQGQRFIASLGKASLGSPRIEDLGLGTRFTYNFLATKEEFSKAQESLAAIAYQPFSISYPGPIDERTLNNLRQVLLARMEAAFHLEGRLSIIPKFLSSPNIIILNFYQKWELNVRMVYFPIIMDYSDVLDAGDRDDNTLFLPLYLPPNQASMIITEALDRPLLGLRLLSSLPHIWLAIGKQREEKGVSLQRSFHYSGLALVPDEDYDAEEVLIQELQSKAELASLTVLSYPVTITSNIPLLKEIIHSFGGETHGVYGSYLFYTPSSEVNYDLHLAYAQVITGNLPTMGLSFPWVEEAYLSLPYGDEYVDAVSVRRSQFSAPLADWEDAKALRDGIPPTPIFSQIEEGEIIESNGNFSLELSERSIPLFSLANTSIEARKKAQRELQALWESGFFLAPWAEYYYRRQRVISNLPLSIPIQLLEGEENPEAALQYLRQSFDALQQATV